MIQPIHVSVVAMARLTKLSRSITGKVVIVTGAASGMGRATAQLLADEGARVGLVDRDEDGLSGLAKELAAIGAAVHAVPADVTDAAAVDESVADIRGALGPIDGLVNNAGIGAWAPIDSDDFTEQWPLTLAVNLTSYTQYIRACLDDLK